MARFINSPNERNLVNKYVDSYMTGTSDYAKYLDSAPSFVTYYSKDVNESMENAGLGVAKEIVGYESPLRYNKIIDMPLYGVEQIDPSFLYDDISGFDTEAELTAIIIPDTLQPTVDDLVLFSYHETIDNENLRLYRVTDVNISAIDSNTYYRVSLSSSPYSIEILDSRQVIDTYHLIYNHIGTDRKTLLLQSSYISAKKISDTYEALLNSYIDNYYDTELGAFLYYDINSHNAIYDVDVHKFLQRNPDLLVNEKSFMKNIVLTNYHMSKYKSKKDNVINNYYYQCMEDIRLYNKINVKLADNFNNNIPHIEYAISRLKNSTFDILPRQYFSNIGTSHKNKNELDNSTYYDILIELRDSLLMQTNGFINMGEEIKESIYDLMLTSLINKEKEKLSRELNEEELKEINDLFNTTIKDIIKDDNDSFNTNYIELIFNNDLSIDNMEEKKKLIIERLHERLSNFYFINRYQYDINNDKTEVERKLDLDFIPDDNELPSIISYILYIRQYFDITKLYEEETLSNYLEESLVNIISYNRFNYYYTPILLYFLNNFMEELINK